MNFLNRKWLFAGLGVMAVGAIAAAIGILVVLWTMGRDLPDYRQLAEYEPPVTSRIHAGDGSLIGVYAREKRMFVPIEAMPNRVVAAFISAEDKTFFTHSGIDVEGILVAMVRNVGAVINNRRPVGASTITQQVAKNFLLTNELSYKRKIKEMILAFRIEQAFEKHQILELYLNEIYLGRGTYGVAAAALNYFDKSLDELTVAEAAYLAALPKAPNNYHPIRNHDRAIARRNWVIGEMFDNGFIEATEAELAQAESLDAKPLSSPTLVDARYFVSAIGKTLTEQFGEDALFEGGLSIRTTVEPRLQQVAQRVLREGLSDFDRRNGWRGPVANVAEEQDALSALSEFETNSDLTPWHYGLVVDVDGKGEAATIRYTDGSEKKLTKDAAKWALSGKANNLNDLLNVWDVVITAPDGKGGIVLRQLPEVNGALVAMDPHTGRVVALVGGFSYAKSRFNRATQAKRQPGSAFKPFVYAAALDHGFTPASLVLDAPFVAEQGPGQPLWKPANYTNRFYGPSTLRLGIEKSRNLMTVRLAQYVGMEVVVDYAKRFGLGDNIRPLLSMSLGSGEVTPLELANAYSMLVNGGKRVKPHLIDRVQDRRGQTIFKADDRLCGECQQEEWDGTAPPRLPDTREQVISPATAYQSVSMMEGVVQRGTGVRVRSVGKPLAGKTGTTDESRDTWFAGFSPDLTVVVFVGYDTPKSLGRKETGSSVAAPIFRDFMAEALKGKPGIPFRVPPGISLVRVDARTGKPAVGGSSKGVILEAFKPGTEPKGAQQVLDGTLNERGGGQTISGTGDLY